MNLLKIRFYTFFLVRIFYTQVEKKAHDQSKYSS